MAQHTVRIEFDVPDTVSRDELRSFIVDALDSWGSRRHPADHLFNSLRRVKVTFIGPAHKVSAKAVREYQARLERAYEESSS